jgi:hypothetical protein
MQLNQKNMNRHIPYDKLFNRAKRVAFWQDVVLWTSAVIAALSIGLTNFEWIHQYINVQRSLVFLNVIATFLAVVFVILEIVVNFSFYKSTREKHLDLLDHAFNEDFTGEKSTGYFNSANVPAGVYKLAVLTFENSLFTSVISKEMTERKWTIAIVIGFLLLTSAAFGNDVLFNGIAQLTLTGVIIVQAVRLQLFTNQMRDIHEEFKSAFNDLKDKSRFTDKPGRLLRLPLRYVTTLTWGSILLSQKIFNKKNPALSVKWEQMKTIYKIQ